MLTQPPVRRIVAVAALLPLAAGAQQAPRALPAPTATFDEPFSQVSGLRELSNGKVLVADARDKVVALVDFAAGAMTKIGREGSGPGEFGLPIRLVTGKGDETYLFDLGNSRYLVIGADGKPGATFMPELAAPAAGGPGPRMMSINVPRTADARGRIYFESARFAQGADGQPAPADSVAILRYDRDSKKLDTLLWINAAKGNAQVSGGQGNMRVMIGQANPLAAEDVWNVFPDGRVAVVRAKDYRIDWMLPNGERRSTPAIKYTPIRVTEAEKKHEEELRNRARVNQTTMMMRNDNGRISTQAGVGAGANAPPLPPLTDWPEVKPPFRRGDAAVYAAPNGDLWVRRTTASTDPRGALFDVIGADGKLLFQVRFPERVNLVGFGKDAIYTTLADEDDLLTLRRHAMNEIKLKG